MKSATLQRVLGAIGIFGCSSAIIHMMVEVGAPFWYYIFYFLALLGAFVLGAARDMVSGERQAPVRPWGAPRPNPQPEFDGRNGNGYQPLRRDDGAALDYPKNPPREE